MGAAHVVGLTLNPREFEHLAGEAADQDVRLCSWAEYETQERFDAIFCLDSLAHFASLQDLARGRRRDVYRRFFRKCHDLAAPSGRLCLQTLVVARHADTPQSRDDFAFLARMFPDSSLPSADEVLSSARGLFNAAETRSAARDLETTVRAWLGRLEANRDAAGERYGVDVVERYCRYFEATLRCLGAGYLDVLRLTMKRVAHKEETFGRDAAGSARQRCHSGSRLNTFTLATRSTADIRDWLTTRLAEKLRVAADEVDDRQPFASFGLDSLQMVSLIGDLELWLGRGLAPTLAWDYPTIDALSRRLSHGRGGRWKRRNRVVRPPTSGGTAGRRGPRLPLPRRPRPGRLLATPPRGRRRHPRRPGRPLGRGGAVRPQRRRARQD